MYTAHGTAGVTAAAGGGAALAATGLNVVWILLGAFALLGAGLALLRMVPRRQG
jgi:hypothetical protein